MLKYMFLFKKLDFRQKNALLSEFFFEKYMIILIDVIWHQRHRKNKKKRIRNFNF